MAEYFERTFELGKEGLPGNGAVHTTNLEKLVMFAEEHDTDGTLIPTFLAILKMCFQC